MKYFLGVDGGQSGTTALIGDASGQILGNGEAGPCNHARAEEGRAKLERAVIHSVDEACRKAGLNRESVRFEAACFGMSGGPEDKEPILRSIFRVERLTVTTDAVIALAGATESGSGIVAIAGTGSIAFGRNGQGKTARAGGWGYIFGDEGGAFDIVRQAIRAALRMEEGWGTQTALCREIVDATAARDANEALHRLYTTEWPRQQVATMAMMVDEVAMRGDPIAREILANAAAQLAGLVAAVRGQLWHSGEAAEIAYIGGVFQSQMVLERFRMLVELTDGCRCISPVRGPAEGALIEAYRSVGMAAAIRF